MDIHLQSSNLHGMFKVNVPFFSTEKAKQDTYILLFWILGAVNF